MFGWHAGPELGDMRPGKATWLFKVGRGLAGSASNMGGDGRDTRGSELGGGLEDPAEGMLLTGGDACKDCLTGACDLFGCMTGDLVAGDAGR